MLLLLSAFGAADASATQGTAEAFGRNHISVLLRHGAAAVTSEPAFPSGRDTAVAISLPVASLAQSRVVWEMRPPSAQSTTMHAVTSLGR